MTIISSDSFTGYSAPATSGSAAYTTTDNTRVAFNAEFRGSATTGDQVDFTVHFTTGDVTFRARWTSSTVLVLERVSTVPGTSNGTATLQTFTGTSTNKPRSTGDLVRLFVTVNRGAADASTALTFGWHGRGGGTPATTNTFNIDGELTPTGADFAITGTSFRNRPELIGRTPDGGPGIWAVGWNRSDFNGAVNRDNGFRRLGVSAEGECTATLVSNSGDILSGTGAEGDQTMRAFATIAAGTLPSMSLAVRLTGTSDTAVNGDVSGDETLTGYILFLLFGGGSTNVNILKYEVDSGTQVFADSLPDGYDDNTEHSYAFRAEGEDLVVTVDGVDVFTYTDTGTAILAGDPGLGLERHNNETAGITVSKIEVESEVIVLDFCGNLWSAHDFLGTLADVDGQTTDTLPMQGTWAAHPSSAALLANDAGHGEIVGAGRAVYRDASILDLPADYCVNVIATYPRVLGSDPGNPGDPGTPRVLLWEDEFNGIEGDPLDGRVNDGGTWEMLDTAAGQEGAAAILDGAGMVYQPADATKVGNAGVRAYRINGLTLPADYDVEIDVYNTSNGYGDVGAPVRMQPNGSAPDPVEQSTWSYTWRVQQNQAVPFKNLYHAVIDSDPTGGLGTVNAMGPPGSTVTFEARVRGVGSAPAVVRVYFGGTSAVPGACGPLGIEEITFYDGQLGQPRHNFDSGPPGLYFSVGGSGAESALRVKAFRIYAPGCTPPTPGDLADVGEVASTELLARYDAATDTGYVLRQTFDHSDPDNPPIGTYELEERSAGTPTLMRSATVALAHDAAYQLRFQPGGTVLYAEVNGIELWTFNVATDLADETSALVTNHASGAPGLGGSDASGTGAFLRLEQFRVYADSDPCACVTGFAIYALEDFHAADVSDIAGRTPSGGPKGACLANGLWEAMTAGTVGIASNRGVQTGTPAEANYRITGLGGNPNQSVEVTWALDTVPATPCWAAPMVRCDEAANSGYRFRVETETGRTVYRLERLVAGVATNLMTVDSDVDDVPVLDTGPHTARICVSCLGAGSSELVALADGEIRCTATDSSLPTGVQGISVYDADTSLALTQIIVSSCLTGAPTCTEEFPGSGGTPGTTAGGVYDRDQVAWPRLDLETQPIRTAGSTDLIVLPYVRENTVWVPIATIETPGTDDEEGRTVTSTVSDIGCAETILIPPPPLVEGGVPLGTYNTILNGRRQLNTDSLNMGHQGTRTASGLLSLIDTYTTLGMQMIVNMTPGDHSLYMSVINGVMQFDRDKWSAQQQIFNTAPVKAAVAAAVGAGVLRGCNVMDEPQVSGGRTGTANTWGPPGTMHKNNPAKPRSNSIDDMAAEVKSIFPTLAVGVAATMDEFDPSWDYRVIDFTMGGVEWKGGAATGIPSRDRAIAMAHRGRHEVVFNINILAGGGRQPCGPETGGIGVEGRCRVGPAQLYERGTILGDHGTGIIIWRYDSAFFSRVENLVALANLRAYLSNVPARSWYRF
jgi:hypothetical protein